MREDGMLVLIGRSELNGFSGGWSPSAVMLQLADPSCCCLSTLATVFTLQGSTGTSR